MSTKLGLMCLAQGHNAVRPVRVKPAAPRSKTSKVNQQSVLNLYIFHHFPKNLERQSL